MLRVPAVVLVSISLFAPGLRAQSTGASVAGRVTDPSKALVAGASVAAINITTNVRTEAATSADGEYYLTDLPPGPYRLEVEKAGFEKLLKPDVILHVQDELEIDFEMAIGSADQTVTVQAGAPTANTQSAAVSTVIDQTFVGNIPLNGHSFQSLITLTPGVVLTAANSTSSGQFSINGQRADANYFMVDGVSANVGVQSGTGLGEQGAGAVPALSAAGGTNTLVSVDDLQEFRIETSTYAPEFGRTPGGQISIVTRSGTNQFHGDVFEYFRNDALDANDWFANAHGLAKPAEHQNDFGGVFGAPIQRDKTFVFVSYEGLRLQQPVAKVTEVPSLAARASALAALAPIFAAFPIPNGADAQNGTTNGLSEYTAIFSNPSSLNAASVRLDRVVSSKLTLFARYNYAPSEAESRLGSFGNFSANTIGVLKNNFQSLTAGGTWIASPHVIDEFRFNWSRNLGDNYQTLDGFGGAVVPPESLLHPSFAPPGSVYQVTLNGTNAFFGDGPNADNVERQVNTVDSVAVTEGSHQLKFGVDYRRLFPIYRPLQYVQSFTFNGATGALNNTVAALAVNATSTSNDAPHATNFSAFVQDTVQATSRLTVTLGLRWEVNPPPGLAETTQPLSLTSANPAVFAIAPPGSPLYNTTYGNFAPRLGAAFRLRNSTNWATVLRAGEGIFFDVGNDTAMNNFTGFPFTARRTASNVPFPVDPSLLKPPTVAPGAVADFLTATDPHLQLPYTAQWSVAVQQALGAPNSLTVTYVGAVGQRLIREERYVNPSSQFGQLTLITNDGHSNYEGLQVEFERRLSRGLQALASYTLARSNDDVSNDTIPELPAVTVNPMQDWGPSDFDVRHSATGALTYAVPTAPITPVLRAILAKWSVDTIVTARSALPVNVLTGVAIDGVSGAQRPDVNPGVPFYLNSSNDPGGRIINQAAFNKNIGTRQGALGRNALRGFGMSQVDFALHRDFPLRESFNLQFRAEAFNLFNQANFGLPTNTLSSGLFGQPTQTLAPSLGAGGVAGGGFSPLYQVGGPRSIQFALKLLF